MNIALIVAAGSGQRFLSSKPKQFQHLFGKPVLLHTLERFETCPEIDEIVLVLSDDAPDEFCSIAAGIGKLKSIVVGGATRAVSVKNGLDALNAAPSDVIAVHDGVRPLVTVDEISRTVLKARETGAACLVSEVTDTIKQVSDSYIDRTIDRSRLRRALTPQAFTFEVISSAFADADLSEAITDECYLVEKTGVKIALVEGSSQNIKITRVEDMILAEAILRERSIA